jgi:flagellar basal-body rod protein FlgB
MNLFENTRIPILSKALDAYSLRHQVISANIANIGTPGYKAQSVQFENALASAMSNSVVEGKTTNERHMGIGILSTAPDGPISIVENTPGELSNEDLKSGINDVDVDSEMAELAKNQIRFKYASRLISESFRGIQKSIRGTV